MEKDEFLEIKEIVEEIEFCEKMIDLSTRENFVRFPYGCHTGLMTCIGKAIEKRKEELEKQLKEI